MKNYSFLALGYITFDLRGKKKLLGGSSAYAGILVRNLGFDSAIVTSVGEDFDFGAAPLNGIRVAYQVEGRTTTFIDRRYILTLAGRIKEETIPEEWCDADIVFVCPVFDEIDERIIEKFECSMLGVAPQGWMRTATNNGRIERKRWDKADEVLPAVDFAIISEEDAFEDDVHRYIELSNIFVVTRGRSGADLYIEGEHQGHIPAFERPEVDATGAGDVFGAAFLLRYFETGDAIEAAIFASCSASFVVEAEGVNGVPHRDEIIRRLRSFPI